MKKITLSVLLLTFSLGFSQNAPMNFETPGEGANWTWIVGANGTNAAMEFVANPNNTGINSSATVAKFVAEVAGEEYALAISENIGTFTLDNTNSIVKIMVKKDVVSDFAVKLEGPGNYAHENKVPVPATIENGDWVELTFDFIADIGKVVNKLVIIPDFVSGKRNSNHTVYFDNLTFNSSLLSTKSVAVSKFVAYPNPTKNNWTISSPTFEIASIQLIDVLGKNVMSIKPKSNQFTIDASKLNAGLYFARINTANGSSSLKLVKK